MFTGIIEELGIVTSIIRSPQTGRLAVSAAKIGSEVKAGDSIAVNGVCLTATSVRRKMIEFDLSAETQKRSTLQDLKIGERVNLERALAVAGRLGGHLVSGHVDGIGEIRKKVSSGKGFNLYISLPSSLLNYLVPKGSIALDGVSLTIVGLRNGLLVVSIIPHTAESTSFKNKNVGDRVNIEVDILSKYVEKHLRGNVDKDMFEDTLVRTGFLPLGWIDN